MRFKREGRICEAEGIAVDEFGVFLADIAPLVGEEVKRIAETIHEGKYEKPLASLKTWARAVERIEQHARGTQINDDFPAYASALCQKGIAAGYGMEEVASLIKVLRAGS